MAMPAVSIQITSCVDDHFPGWVECVLMDARGAAHTFVEKISVVCAGGLGMDSAYPCHGAIQCEIKKQWKDQAGRAFAQICTDQPWGVASVHGQSLFTVFSAQLVG